MNDTLNSKERHIMIFNIWNQSIIDNKNINIIIKLLEKIRKDEMLGKRNVNAEYVNLLCILLAKTHDFKFLKHIVKTKISGDLFYYIDSNLLFEFSPRLQSDSFNQILNNRNVDNARKTCIKDTLDFVNKNPNYIEKKWYNVYVGWIRKYAQLYEEDMVIKYWNSYESIQFKERLNELIDL